VKLINPLGEETSVMRTHLLPGILEIAAGNQNRGNAAARLFEIGNTFAANSETELPTERLSLAVAGYGENFDFLDMKGIIETFLTKLGIEYRITAPRRGELRSPAPRHCEERSDEAIQSQNNHSDTGLLRYARNDECGIYHPYRSATVTLEDGTPIGCIGQLIDSAVIAGELDMQLIIEKADLMRYYSPLGRFPGSDRDMALVVDETAYAGDIEAVIKGCGEKLLTEVKLFDVYRGKQLEQGKKSLAYSLKFQAEDRTLTDEEVAAAYGRILKAVETKTGATLRD
jgi:phenylalanyl-tRNA synthetase beta chain